MLAQLIRDGHSDSESLTDLQREQFEAWLRADLNHLEAIFTYYDLGLISGDAFDGFDASICDRLTTKGGRKYWEKEAQFFSSGLGEYVSRVCEPPGEGLDR